jgi:hypothetical protein
MLAARTLLACLQVVSTCPNFNSSNAYQYCDTTLTLTSCKGEPHRCRE